MTSTSPRPIADTASALVTIAGIPIGLIAIVGGWLLAIALIALVESGHAAAIVAHVRAVKATRRRRVAARRAARLNTGAVR